MRRKAEVLLYNQGNTKTNPLTKNQKWTQVVNGKSPPVSKSFLNKNNNSSYQVLNNWNNKINIPTPSSACNVPNDYLNNVNLLFYDPSVVLYNYINPVLTRSYGLVNTTLDTTVIRYTNSTDVNTDISSNYISIIEFTDLADDGYYTLSLNNIPLAFQMNGTEIPISINDFNCTIDTSKIVLNIYYNDKIITNTNAFEYTFIQTKINITNTSSLFSGSIFIGYLSINNILLYGTPGYIYKFRLFFDYTVQASNIEKITTSINSNINANVTTSYLSQNEQTNCTISCSPSPTINTLGSFTITAV
jgi:hypothetical protein